MKFRITFACVFLTFAAYAQLPSIGLSDAMIVTEGSTFGSQAPHVSLTDGNVPLVQWTKGGTSGGIFTSRLVGGSFTSPVQVTPAGMAVNVGSSYGVDLECASDTAFVCFKTASFFDGKVYAVRSLDGGQTWGDTLRIDSENTNFPYMPELFVRPGGHPMVGYIRSDSFEVVVDQKFTQSMDGGLTWSPEISTSPTGLGFMPCECCPPTQVAYDNTVMSLWRYNEGNVRDIHAVISTDNGSTFTQFERIDSTYWVTGQCPTTGPDATISGDSVVVTWKSDGTFNDRVYVGAIHKTNFGVGQHLELDMSVGAGVIQNFPKISGNGDTLGIVWQDNRNGNLDVFFAYSVTGRHGFSAPINLTDSTMAAAQVNPHIDYADGTFHIVFQSQSSKVYYYSATIGAITGIADETPMQFGIEIAPNPIVEQGKVLINNAGGPVNLEAFDLSGKRVLEVSNVNDPSIILDVRTLKSGVYIVRATNAKGQSVEQRIVVQ